MGKYRPKVIGCNQSVLIDVQKRSAKHKLQRNESNDLRLLSSSSTDVQLSRLRNHNILTEYNPNYEFGGSTCTLQDLKEISREKLNLVKYGVESV